MRRPRFSRAIFSLALILIIAALLRFHKLANRDLWFDEVLSVARAYGEISRIDPQPPLYFLILRFWINLAGNSEFAVRFPSVIFALASIFLIYKIGYFLLDRKTALLAAFVLALSPLHIWYAQEARAFSLFILSVLFLTYFFLVALKTDKDYRWIITCLILVAVLYVSYWALLLIPALSLVFILPSYRTKFVKWSICVAFALLLFIPWLGNFLQHIDFIAKGFWVAKPQLKQILFTVENFNLGYTATSKMYLASWILFGPLFISGVTNLIRDDKKDVLLFLSGTLFIPIITTWLISQRFPIYLDRNLISFSPFYYIVFTYGLKNSRLYLKILCSIFIISLMTFSLYFYYLNYVPSSLEHHLGAYDKKPLKPAVKFIMRHKLEHDIIAFTNDGLSAPFVYYLRYNPVGRESIPLAQFYYFISTESQDNYWRKMHKELKYPTIDITKDFAKISKHQRIWLISASWARDYTLDDNSRAVREWVETRYKRISELWVDGILVGLYGKH